MSKLQLQLNSVEPTLAKTLSSIRSAIEKLEREAEQMKNGIVREVRAQIQKHGLTAEDLFGRSAGGVDGGGRKAAASAKSVSKLKAAPRAPKFGDSNGNVWGGMGKRPAWLQTALAEGASLDDFLLSKPKAAKPATPKKASAPVVAKKSKPAAKKAAKQAAVQAKRTGKPAVASKAAKATTEVKRRAKPAKSAAAPAVEEGAAAASE
jgi:DNA-binding protein H-NS